jgi:hypothetical protein
MNSCLQEQLQAIQHDEKMSLAGIQPPFIFAIQTKTNKKYDNRNFPTLHTLHQYFCDRKYFGIGASFA